MFRNAETSTTYLHTSYPIEDDAASNKAKAQYWKYDPSHGLRTPGKAFFQHIANVLTNWSDWPNKLCFKQFGMFLVAISAPYFHCGSLVLDFSLIILFFYKKLTFSDILNGYLFAFDFGQKYLKSRNHASIVCDPSKANEKSPWKMKFHAQWRVDTWWCPLEISLAILKLLHSWLNLNLNQTRKLKIVNAVLLALALIPFK
jgi:hypothetical protein